MSKINLFIFDMDGLMFDTGRLAYQSYLKSAEKYDYEIHHNVYYYLTGRTEADILEGMKELYGADRPISEWRQAMAYYKEKIFQENQRVFKKKGLVELLDFAKENQVMRAVASSNSLEKVKLYLEIEGVLDYFDIIVTGDEVKSGKPNPEIFLTAMEKAGGTPEQTLIFEDSAAGIEAAGRAKIKSILVEDDITDLPVKQDGFPLLKDLSKIRDEPAPADFQFADLLAARDFLAEKNLTI